MKKLTSLLSFLCVIIISMFLLTGCVEKTYKLVGMVDVEKDQIVYYENLTEENKKVLDHYKNFTIKLGVRGDAILNYTLESKPQIIEYTIYGTYTLTEDVLEFSFTYEDGTIYPMKQQYTNNRIIFYDETLSTYLVFE